MVEVGTLLNIFYHILIMDNKEFYEFKKQLKFLSKIRGRHTELVSVYIPAGYEISKVAAQIKDEQGTATNIKSKGTRKNVLSALERVMQHLRLYKNTPPNGLIIFSGNISEDEGNPKIELYTLNPPEPISVRIYRCDQQFVLDPLLEMIEDKRVFGLIIVERGEASIGLLRGKKVELLKHLTSRVPGKFRAGGQSSVRFARLREIAADDFKDTVGETANEIFLAQPNLEGILIGGGGYTKYEFEEGEYLHHELRKKILGVADTAYTELFGLNELVDKSAGILENLDITKEKDIVTKFLKELIKDDSLAAYGEKEVRKYLEAGAVDTLLLSEGLNKNRIKIKCGSCGNQTEKTETDEELFKLEQQISSIQCENCGNLSLNIEEKVDLLEELADLAQEGSTKVEVISTETEEGSQLLRAFGGIAAIVRYRL
ncbi:MAG: Peptide chain release factor subunit 1 [Candidatus Methanofastidiosum methylothiophilum]|uniref:Peptide chain release factor subunit 1 n=1 Tax=Candidatus Methanofastidiosum methylothiophilum TaxID=1705564 RepID=A0A150IQV1_9EURY|nr:MAG: Peptide chain release factor subunit 1 [Candidatus Methanofastidiosum methylthiophilus]KYC47340.1 MAG: Peptide chain release factor subunit 1 [Candidatus Methanofastidiosum methylthiophilus]KYC49791.1 MAG: Peptide chain release factor subunit 1 [Candidatus Methanofastidiosum methylthiophilus]